MTDDIHARLEDIERRLAALEVARREPAGETAPATVGRDAGEIPPPALRGERRTDLRPFPAPQASPPSEGSVPAAGEGPGGADED